MATYVPVPPNLEDVTADPQILDTAGRLPATIGRAGRSANLLGTTGPFISGGPVLQAMQFIRHTNTPDGQISPAELVGGFLMLDGTPTDYYLPTGPQIDAYITSEQIKVSNALGTYVNDAAAPLFLPLAFGTGGPIPLLTFRCIIRSTAAGIVNIKAPANPDVSIGVANLSGAVCQTADGANRVTSLSASDLVELLFFKLSPGRWAYVKLYQTSFD